MALKDCSGAGLGYRLLLPMKGRSNLFGRFIFVNTTSAIISKFDLTFKGDSSCINI